MAAEEFYDGSFAIGVWTSSKGKQDEDRVWITDDWQRQRDARPYHQTDFEFAVGMKYYGIIVADAESRPIFAVFRINKNYLHTLYYSDGNWRWTRFEDLENHIGKFSLMTKDPDSTRKIIRCDGKPIKY